MTKSQVLDTELSLNWAGTASEKLEHQSISSADVEMGPPTVASLWCRQTPTSGPRLLSTLTREKLIGGVSYKNQKRGADPLLPYLFFGHPSSSRAQRAPVTCCKFRHMRLADSRRCTMAHSRRIAHVTTATLPDQRSNWQAGFTLPWVRRRETHWLLKACRTSLPRALPRARPTGCSRWSYA